ncbi:hypothetical protein RB195_019129 [Necator americanus]|uniref:Uncharacterized protein n=1 Tax=Necator americanus TaxID=51031 RepID=A0ABR1CCQ6_NECAM
MTRGRYQHLAPPSKVATKNHLRIFGHVIKRPVDRLIQQVLKSLSDSSWKRPPGRKRKFWNEVVKEDSAWIDSLGETQCFAGYGIVTNGSIPCERSQKIEKVRQSYIQGQHTSATMPVVVWR